VTTKQTCDLRVGDILLFKDEESRIITDIDRIGEVWMFRTTSLSGESPRLNTYASLGRFKVWGTQEVLF
jgi:hypothetical protein